MGKVAQRMRIVILAPIKNSLYSLLVAHLCLREPGVEVSGIVLRKILNLGRIKSEFRRDGIRLLRKVWRKMILGNRSSIAQEEDSFRTTARRVGLEFRSLPKLARKHQIPLIRVKDLNGADSVSFLKEHRPDLIAFTGGGMIRKQVFDASGLGVFNVHMGILPPYRGMDVVEWPVLEGRHKDVGLGVTLHFMDSGVDTGPIIAAQRVPLKKGDTFERLRARYEGAMVELMMLGVKMARDGDLHPKAQSKDGGQQYFVMHPRLRHIAEKRLANIVLEID